MDTVMIGKVDLHIPMETPLLERIAAYQEVEHCASRNNAIRELIDIGLFVYSHMAEIKANMTDPQIMDELRHQLEEGGAVDFVRKMGHREFRFLSSIFETETKERQRLSKK